MIARDEGEEAGDLCGEKELEQVLGRASKPMRVADITDAVRSAGYRTRSANFRGIVNQTLIKDKRFGSAGRGLYQIKK